MTGYNGQLPFPEGPNADFSSLLGTEEAGLTFTEQDRQNAHKTIGALLSGEAVETESICSRLNELAEADSHQAQFLLEELNQHIESES